MAKPGDIIRSPSGYYYLVTARQNGQIRAICLEDTPALQAFTSSGWQQTSIAKAHPVANLKELVNVLKNIQKAETIQDVKTR